MRCEPEADLGEAADGIKFRHLTLGKGQRGALRPASSWQAARWRLRGLLVAALWILMPAALIAAGFFASLAAWRSSGYGAGVGLSLACFVGAPVLLATAVCLLRIRREQCIQGCCALMFMAALAYCVAPLAAAIYVSRNGFLYVTAVCV